MQAIFRTLLVGLTVFTWSKSWSQYLFDPTIIHEIRIDFYDANWDYLLDSMATANNGTGSGTGRILADVTIDGSFYDSCGVRYKGNSSMDPNSDKNPFNIDLNYVKAGQEHQGKDKIKLANQYADPSMIREVLTYELANQYMDCPKACFTKLYINNGYRGIYTNTESIDNEFLKEFYGSSKNSFFKCDPNSFDIWGDNSNLSYQTDSMAYDTLYDMKSLYGLADIQALCYELAYNPQNINSLLDLDRVMWFLAFSSAVVHNDGYTAFAHNYYIYKMDNGSWSVILWDVNMAFGGLPWDGTGVWAMSSTDMQEQDPLIHIGSATRPLIANLLTIPQLQKIYFAHYRTIIEENVANDYYFQRAQWWHDLIDPDVPNEPYPFYTYQEFIDNMTQDIGNWLNLRAGLQNLMSNRLVYLNSLQEMNYVQPYITNVTAPVEPDPFTTVTITADVILETGVWLGYRHSQFDRFTKTQMFDDGLHNDGAAGDDIYGAEIALSGSDVQYYIFAENNEAARFYPARAEYEFLTLSPKKGLVINELCADNATIANDQVGEYEDWIELYNNSDDPITLSNYFLSDEPWNLFKWSMPNHTINPGEYYIVWADEEPGDGSNHANFKLGTGGETLILSTPVDSVIDIIEYPAQYTDITYGRLPNGTGPFDYLYPTINAENSTAVGQEESSTFDMTVYPNPAGDFAYIRIEKEVQTIAHLFDINGRLIQSQNFNGTQLKLDVSELPSGTYIIKLESGQAEKLIIR